ncbi:ABC transporter permease subunit [Paenibacillus sp. LMG 31461]|uniref:ABC transporter permease subunit n=1 Tax=Paenibacillus plantarum TaxID=2654975 RepID=A0ABX1X3D5_9BACL|nr:ABC transporter permease subunit [Paenibacillus plantarum]NOU62603.1 ABC transporter permease subunit [Paenibacillus plantarum]
MNEITLTKRQRTRVGRRLSVFVGHVELFLLTLPAILYFIVFHYLPIGGVIVAFKDYRYDLGILGSKWVGVRNFEFFLTSQDAWRITRNTVAYSSTFLVIGIMASVTVALLLFEVRNRYAIKVYQTSMILPRFLSWVIVGYISYTLLNPELGILNQLRVFFGMEPVQWFGDTKYWPYILVVSNLWKHIGLDCIIYYAALLGIDQEQYEAARIDGANRLRQMWHISIPSLAPLMFILGILAVGDLFRGDFGLFYQIPRNVGTLYPVTDVIDTYVFRGLRLGEIGMTAAVGLFQSVVGLVLVVSVNLIVKKIRPDNSLF